MKGVSSANQGQSSWLLSDEAISLVYRSGFLRVGYGKERDADGYEGFNSYLRKLKSAHPCAGFGRKSLRHPVRLPRPRPQNFSHGGKAPSS